MKVAIYNIKDYEKPIFMKMGHQHQLLFITEALSMTSVAVAKGCDVVCCFVTDCLNKDMIETLHSYGIRLIALRSTGFDHVDLKAARDAGITVVHVPKYSPEAIAEFAVALILLLNRKLINAYVEGQRNNFSLDGLIGFNLHKKIVGIIGTGNIGTAFAKIMNGFGCHLLAVDPVPNPVCKTLNVRYVSLDELLSESDIISLHCPLNDQTKYIINEQACIKMKENAMLINTGRGGLCDTQALIAALESGPLTYAGLDVYEKEKALFFKDHHSDIIKDPLFLKLRSLPNVMITPHQAFLTKEAIDNIVKTTLNNISAFEKGKVMNQIT